MYLVCLDEGCGQWASLLSFTCVKTLNFISKEYTCFKHIISQMNISLNDS